MKKEDDLRKNLKKLCVADSATIIYNELKNIIK